MKRIYSFQIQRFDGKSWKCFHQIEKVFDEPDRMNFYIKDVDSNFCLSKIPSLEEILFVLHYLYPSPEFRIDLISSYETKSVFTSNSDN